MDKLLDRAFGVSRWDVVVYTLIGFSAAVAYDADRSVSAATVPPLFLMLAVIFANVSYMRAFDKLQKLRSDIRSAEDRVALSRVENLEERVGDIERRLK
jgi:hypothetical protein